MYISFVPNFRILLLLTYTVMFAQELSYSFEPDSGLGASLQNQTWSDMTLGAPFSGISQGGGWNKREQWRWSALLRQDTATSPSEKQGGDET